MTGRGMGYCVIPLSTQEEGLDYLKKRAQVMRGELEQIEVRIRKLENSSAMAGGGAGISTAQTIASKGIEAVLTGNCGPNAYQVLSAAGIKVVTGVSGKVRDAIQNYKSGEFKANSQPNVAGHFGMGGGMGHGRGMGRGMGRR